MTTPMRQQYLDLKRQYPDAILFFRLGDFYETFDEDAEVVARVCDIVLTSRPVGKDTRVPLAGVPYHSADTYIAKVLRAGLKFAIAEQSADGVGALMKRQVVRVVNRNHHGRGPALPAQQQLPRRDRARRRSSGPGLRRHQHREFLVEALIADTARPARRAGPATTGGMRSLGRHLRPGGSQA